MSRGKNESRGEHVFCLTRWTVRGEALAAVINNRAELMELWDYPWKKIEKNIHESGLLCCNLYIVSPII